MNNRTYIVIGSVAFLLGMFLLGIKFYNQDKAEKVSAVIEFDKSLLVRPYSPKLGPDLAPVKVVEFLDPECESCKAFYPYTKMVLEEFPGQVQLIIRYAPFHPNSTFVVKILEASRKQNRYWETLELLFQTQSQWTDHAQAHPELVWKSLSGSSLNIDELKLEMMTPEIRERLEQEIEDGKKLGIRATPTFFINGEELHELSDNALREGITKALSEK